MRVRGALVYLGVVATLVCGLMGYGYSLDGDPVIEGKNLFPARSGTTPTAAGQAQYNTTHHWIAVGDGTYTRAMLSGETVYVVVSSPDLLGNPDNQVIWKNLSGTTYVITNGWFAVNDLATPTAGVTCDVLLGVTPYGYKGSAGTKVFGVKIDGTAGVSMYAKEFTSGTSLVPPGAPLMLDFGDASTADWLEIALGGYYQGDKP